MSNLSFPRFCNPLSTIFPQFAPTVIMVACVTTLVGCATVAGAKQDAVIAGRNITGATSAGDMPATGAFVADNGVVFTVTELNASNIPTPRYMAKNPVTLPPATAGNGVSYVMAAGDMIDIRLPNYPEITPLAPAISSNPYANGFLIDQAGYIQFPMIGKVKAAGLTVTQLTDVLTSRLSRYLRLPDPQVRVISYRANKFYIDGEVKNPGEFAIADQPVSIYSAIAMAGGTSDTSDTEDITLVRNGRTYHFGLKSAQKLGYSPNNLLVRNGDAIHINQKVKNKVTVIGEFGKPNPVEIPDEGITLASVIGEASGLDRTTANARRVFILREDAARNTSDLYYVDLTTITNFALANRFKMQPNDIVYVDPTGLARWNRVITLISPSISLPGLLRQL